VRQTLGVRVEPRDPRTFGPGWGPIRHYHVVFWRQPLAPGGHRQERIASAASEHDLLEAADVHEAIEWADAEARLRQSTYTPYAVVTLGEQQGQVWLAGVDPTVHSSPNFERRHPPDVNPVGGTPTEVYGPRQ
jgi:hypothetical protein